jgi:hypothetical protein
MDLISAEYGWTDAQILDRTLARLAQIMAAIQRRQWLADLAHRRLETAKLRTLCGYIAATMQLAEGADNVMLAAAADLSLGTGTENTGTAPAAPPAATPAPAPVPGPVARVAVATLPDAPAAIRPGQHAPVPAGANPIRLDDIGRMFGGAL